MIINKMELIIIYDKTITNYKSFIICIIKLCHHLYNNINIKKEKKYQIYFENVKMNNKNL